MDLLGALLDEIILEVFYENWVQAVDYEHVPFRCRKCHERGHLFRDFPLNKMESRTKSTTGKETESYDKVGSRGKGGRRNQRKVSEEKKFSQNMFRILEEEKKHDKMNQILEDSTTEKEK